MAQCFFTRETLDFQVIREHGKTFYYPLVKSPLLTEPVGLRALDTFWDIRQTGNMQNNTIDKQSIQYHLTGKSSNSKTGKIPVSTTSRNSCPNSCPLKDSGCYADSGFHLSMHWTKVSETSRGIDFASFCESIGKLKTGQLWRHNQAGDLPGVNESIDYAKLERLVEVNGDSKGFTYTHKKQALRTVKGLKAVKASNSKGFTINVSADNDAEVDEFRKLGLPVTVVVAEDSKGYTTADGNKVKICPAQLSERKNADGSFKVTCKTCGLCALPNRPHVVGFRAHGTKKALIQLG